jgi:hypothetical protein
MGIGTVVQTLFPGDWDGFALKGRDPLAEKRAGEYVSPATLADETHLTNGLTSAGEPAFSSNRRYV